MEAVIGADGQVPDFVVQDAATTSASTEWIGRRFLEIWPELAAGQVFEALRRLTQTGGAWTTTVAEPSGAPWGVVGTQVRAVRLGQRIAVVWRLPESATRTSSTVAVPGL
jgi:hypothetical protein